MFSIAFETSYNTYEQADYCFRLKKENQEGRRLNIEDKIQNIEYR